MTILGLITLAFTFITICVYAESTRFNNSVKHLEYIESLRFGMYTVNVDKDETKNNRVSLSKTKIVSDKPLKFYSNLTTFDSKVDLPCADTVDFFTRRSDGWILTNYNRKSIAKKIQKDIQTFYGFHVNARGQIDKIYFIP